MKRLFFIVLYSGAVISSFAQGSSMNYTVRKNTACVVAVCPVKMNVLYLGIDNPLRIAVTGVSSNAVVAKISDGTLTRTGVCEYNARVMSSGTKKVSVYKKAGGRLIHCGDMLFRVKRVPDPMLVVGGKNGGSITKAYLLANGAVNVEMPNFDFEIDFDVLSYRVTATIDGFVNEHKCRGNRFPVKVRTLINLLNRGTYLYIEDIKVRGPDGMIRTLPTVKFKIR